MSNHSEHSAKQTQHHLHHAERQLRTARRLSLISLITLGLGLLSVGLALYLLQQSKSGSSDVTVTPNTVLAFDHPAKTPAYDLHLLSQRRDSTGNQIFQPEPGHEFIIITLSLKNLSPKPVQFFPVLQTYLKDPSGQTYNLSPAPLTSPINAGSLLPDDTVTGELSYQIPIGLSRLVFYFDPGWPGAGKTSAISLSQ